MLLLSETDRKLQFQPVGSHLFPGTNEMEQHWKENRRGGKKASKCSACFLSNIISLNYTMRRLTISEGSVNSVPLLGLLTFPLPDSFRLIPTPLTSTMWLNIKGPVAWSTQPGTLFCRGDLCGSLRVTTETAVSSNECDHNVTLQAAAIAVMHVFFRNSSAVHAGCNSLSTNSIRWHWWLGTWRMTDLNWLRADQIICSVTWWTSDSWLQTVTLNTMWTDLKTECGSSNSKLKRS
jgi:hypothetical protein